MLRLEACASTAAQHEKQGHRIAADLTMACCAVGRAQAGVHVLRDGGGSIGSRAVCHHQSNNKRMARLKTRLNVAYNPP